MARIEQLDLLNEVVISHDDDDDFKLWFTIITVRESGMKFVPPPDKRVEFPIHCTFDEAKQIYGIMVGTILQLLCDTGGMPKEKWKDVCICLCRGKIKDGCCVPKDSVGGCDVLDTRNVFNQHFEMHFFGEKTPVFDPFGKNESDVEDE